MFTNKDLMFCFAIAIVVVGLWILSKRHPAIPRNTMPPLPINQYTNGVANGNTNDIATRVNFREQPT